MRLMGSANGWYTSVMNDKQQLISDYLSSEVLRILLKHSGIRQYRSIHKAVERNQ